MRLKQIGFIPTDGSRKTSNWELYNGKELIARIQKEGLYWMVVNSNPPYKLLIPYGFHTRKEAINNALKF